MNKFVPDSLSDLVRIMPLLGVKRPPSGIEPMTGIDPIAGEHAVELSERAIPLRAKEQAQLFRAARVWCWRRIRARAFRGSCTRWRLGLRMTKLFPS